MRKPLLLLLAVLAAMIGTAFAQDNWPTKPIKLIAPFAPASTPDTLARILAEGLRKRLGQPVVVENKAGGAGMIGTDAVAKAAPDGYTIGLSVVGPLANNALLYKKMPYNLERDLIPVTVAVNQPSLLVVRSDLPATNLSELIADLKKRPGKGNYASIGNGSLSHLTMELVATRSGTQIVHVPYAGSSQAVMAVVSGEVDMACLPALAVKPFIQSGKLRALGVTTARRSALLPSIPTLREQGLTDVDAGAWIGVVAPAGTPGAIVDRLYREIGAVLKDPATEKLLAQQMMEVVGTSPQAFAALLQNERARWKPVIVANGIHLD